MKLIRDYLASHGVDGRDLIVSGRATLEKTGTARGFSGFLMDRYDPALQELSLHRGELTWMRLEPGTPMFEELARTLLELKLVKLFPRDVSAGAKAPQDEAFICIPFAKLDELARAEEELAEALYVRDEQRALEAQWTKFRHSETFERHPCGREDFLALFREFQASDYVRAMPFADYYTWYLRSAEMLDADDALKADSGETAVAMLEGWKGGEIEAHKDWLAHRFRVHPRHRGAFDALVDGVVAKGAEEASGPRP
jgi:hypothetical protein